MDIDNEYDIPKGKAITAIEMRKAGKGLADIKSNQMDFYNEHDKSQGQAKTSIEKKKMNLNNLEDKKTRKGLTDIKSNQIGFGKEKDSNINNPKTEIKSNKINIDAPPKITQNNIQNQTEKKSEINNLYINSINNVRLPEGLYDITFDALKGE